MDGVVYLTIPDNSTRLAALRTGKSDLLISVSWEDARDEYLSHPFFHLYIGDLSCLVREPETLTVSKQRFSIAMIVNAEERRSYGLEGRIPT